jgi:hypothetical protein
VRLSAASQSFTGSASPVASPPRQFSLHCVAQSWLDKSQAGGSISEAPRSIIRRFAATMREPTIGGTAHFILISHGGSRVNSARDAKTSPALTCRMETCTAWDFVTASAVGLELRNWNSSTGERVQ